jgi:hypothetical protein
MMRTTSLWASAFLACAFSSACSQTNSEAPGYGLNARCIESIARIALANPRTNELAANYVGPLGLTPTSSPTAPPFVTKQAEFGLPDRTVHFFAIEGPDAVKALLVKLDPTTAEPRLHLFVINLSGALLSAGVVENGELIVLDIASPQVQAQFQRESVLMATMGPGEGCAIT